MGRVGSRVRDVSGLACVGPQQKDRTQEGSVSLGFGVEGLGFEG